MLPVSDGADVEAQYLADVAKRRWPVLVFVIAFDVGCYILRFGAKLLASKVTVVQPWYSAAYRLQNPVRSPGWPKVHFADLAACTTDARQFRARPAGT